MSKDQEKKEITLKEKEEIASQNGEPTRQGVFYSPDVDIYETESAITLLADLPGIEKENLDIKVEDKELTIIGTLAQPQNVKPLYSEYQSGGYMRSFKLGDTVDQANINASLKDGMLTLVLPKAEKVKPRKIEVSVA